MKKILIATMLAAIPLLAAQPAVAGEDGKKIFKSKCAMCHKVDKKKFGPAVKNMNPDNAVLKEVVTNGRKSMPAFGKKLSEEQIGAVVEFLASQRDAK